MFLGVTPVPGRIPARAALCQIGFELFNSKFQIPPENYAKTKWVPPAVG